MFISAEPELQRDNDVAQFAPAMLKAKAHQHLHEDHDNHI
jgi:hypothetical protein